MATPPVPPLPPATAVYPAARPVSPPTASATPAEPRLMDRNHQPKARVKPRGIVRWKPKCKRCEATDCKPHSQGRGMLLAMAHGSKAHRYAPCRPRRARGPALRQAQTVHWTVCVRAQPTVNAALVHRQFAHLPGEICAPWRCSTDGRNGRVVPYPKRPGARSRSPISSERIGPKPSGHTARPAVMHGVRPQKSAEAI